MSSHEGLVYFDLFQLIDDYGVDKEVTALVDKYDFYIETVVNPDGYVYSWDSVSQLKKPCSILQT